MQTVYDSVQLLRVEIIGQQRMVQAACMRKQLAESTWVGEPAVVTVNSYVAGRFTTSWEITAHSSPTLPPLNARVGTLLKNCAPRKGSPSCPVYLALLQLLISILPAAYLIFNRHGSQVLPFRACKLANLSSFHTVCSDSSSLCCVPLAGLSSVLLKYSHVMLCRRLYKRRAEQAQTWTDWP